MTTKQLGSHDDVLLSGHYDTLREAVDKDSTHDIHLTGLQVRYRYVNLTGVTVILKDRYGTVFTLPHSGTGAEYRSNRSLILYKDYEIDNEVDISTEEMKPNVPLNERRDLTDYFKPGFEHRQETNDKVRTGQRAHHGSTKRVGVRAEIMVDSLRNGVYLPEFDVIAYTLSSEKTYYHPCSPTGNIILKRSKGRSKASLNLIYEICDATNAIGDRWININGFITKLKIDRSGRNDCGVCVTFESDLGTTHSGLLTFEEADERFKLFKTKEEALDLGNSAETAKREWEKEKLQLERELQRAKLDNEHLATENKRREQIYDEQKMKNDNDAAREKYQFEAEKRKEEHKAAMRKYALDFIKFVPLVILAIIGVYNSFKKK